MNRRDQMIRPAPSAPPRLLAIGVTLAAVVFMAVLRLYVYPDTIVPLSYVLPLMLALWHRDLRLLWVMAGGFLVISTIKNYWMMPANVSLTDRWIYTVMQWVNIGLGAVVLHAVMIYRRRLHAANDSLAAFNAELEAANEELASREEEILQQNEELQSQAQELESQTAELEQQTEEMQSQGEEMRSINMELSERERTLQGFLQLAQSACDESHLLGEICEAAPRLLGELVVGAALLEVVGDRLIVRAAYGLARLHHAPEMSRQASLAQYVIERDQTAHIADMRLRPDLKLPPLDDGRPILSALSAPVHLEGQPIGVLEVYSAAPLDWSARQVELLHWLTSKCSRAWTAVRLREQLSERTHQAEAAQRLLSDREVQLRLLNEQLEATVAHRTAELERRSGDLRRLASQLSLAEHRERRRIAQMLHDGLQQLLVAARMRLSSGMVQDPDAVKHADELIDQALQVSRSLTAELSPPVLFEDRFESSLRWLARRMEQQHGLHVMIEAEPDIPPVSDDWRVFLFTAVGECLFNVVKHAGILEATLCMSQKNDSLHILIKDAGKGFDVANAKTGAEAGDSFGLFSIRQRVELMGGYATIHSTVGSGTRVELVAPNFSVMPALSSGAIDAEVNSETVARSDGTKPQPSPNDGTIMVVLADDHQMVREGIARMLHTRDDMHVVAQAGNGFDAVSLTEQHSPHVVVMDISMPGLNGIEATRIIRQRWPQVQIIGMSMHEEEEMVAAMRDAGAAAYVVKGAPLENLVSAILEAVAGLRPTL